MSNSENNDQVLSFSSRDLPSIDNIEQHKCAFFSPQSYNVTFTNGEKRQYYRLHSRRPAVAVVIIDGDELLLTSEFGGGTLDYELGFVRGGVDQGEDPAQAAIREMREEVGYNARKLTFLREAMSNTAYHDSNTLLYLAQDIFWDPLKNGDEPEPIQVLRVPLAQIDSVLSHPKFRDARNIVALLMVKSLLKL